MLTVSVALMSMSSTVGAAGRAVDIDSFDVSGKDQPSPEALVRYLRTFGITLTASDPLNVREDRSIYRSEGPVDPSYHTGPGGQLAVVAGTGRNVFIQNGGGPVEFSLWFDTPKSSVSWQRVRLIAATPSGTTHPPWKAIAYDARERVVDSIGEDEIRCFHDIPAQRFELRAPQIRRVTFFADNHHFDGYANLVFDALVLTDAAGGDAASAPPSKPLRTISNRENCPSWPYGPTLRPGGSR